MTRKYTETFAFETCFGRLEREHEARVTYTVEPGSRQTYGQPGFAPQVGPDMDFEIRLGAEWHKVSDDMHDFLLLVIGDDDDWLIESAKEQALFDAAEYADALREQRHLEDVK